MKAQCCAAPTARNGAAAAGFGADSSHEGMQLAVAQPAQMQSHSKHKALMLLGQELSVTSCPDVLICLLLSLQVPEEGRGGKGQGEGRCCSSFDTCCADYALRSTRG